MNSLDLTYSKAQDSVFFPTQEQGFPRFSVVRKGRRVGLTRGAAQAFIEYGIAQDLWFLPKGEIFMMWGDTVSGNIDKYYNRYFLPKLKKLPANRWKWQSRDRVLEIGRATIDFRSADRPENWEGFGYHLIFLNEAGIILEDDYLYENAVLPMLMDYPNCKLLAAGVPKGKRHKNGIHKFYELYEASLSDPVNYRQMVFDSYSNPFIDKEAVGIIANALDDQTRRQEVYGEFIDTNEQAYLYAFSDEAHGIKKYEINENLNLLLSWDFNKSPMTCLVGQVPAFGSARIFEEINIANGSTPEVCEKIIAKYPHFLGSIEVTGDATGRNRTSMVKGNMNHYEIIMDMLGVKKSQLLVPRQNESHENSRIFCNSVLQNADFAITKNCELTIRDCIFAAVDARGELIKSQSQGLHNFDALRYFLHAAFPDFITKNHRYK